MNWWDTYTTSPWLLFFMLENLNFIVSLLLVTILNTSQDLQADPQVSQASLDNLIAPSKFIFHTIPPVSTLSIIRLTPPAFFAQMWGGLPHEETMSTLQTIFLHFIIRTFIDLFRTIPFPKIETLFLSITWVFLRPLYIAVVRNTTPLERHEWLHITIGELSLRLYFAWLTCAVYFGVVDISQHLFGHHFNFDVYVVILTTFLALACTAFIFVRDPVVVFIMAWVVVGLADRKVTFESDAQETFDKLQTVGNTIKPVLLLVLLIYAARR